ncbi:MAG: 30S ribosomal protein S19 [Nanoarchaeota archaeon]|nr:30S ribosomal protein S19 [Nanoarchaeota archaeon]
MSEEESKKRVYYYKGKTLEQLQALTDEELLKIIGARARRSLKRGLTKAQKDLMAKVNKSYEMVKNGKNQVKIKTQSRDAIIFPKMVGLKIEVHNGKIFEPVQIKQEMIGQYLGEFVLTRKKVAHASSGSGGKGKESVSLK